MALHANHPWAGGLGPSPDPPAEQCHDAAGRDNASRLRNLARCVCTDAERCALRNCYWFDIDQPLIERAMDGLVDTSRMVNGKPTSLAELGYNNGGIDDGWQQCDHSGKYWRGQYFHNDTTPNGWPVVNSTLFPDVPGMVKRAHDKGLGINWCELLEPAARQRRSAASRTDPRVACAARRHEQLQVQRTEPLPSERGQRRRVADWEWVQWCVCPCAPQFLLCAMCQRDVPVCA